MAGHTLELEDTLYIPNFKKKIISLSKLLDQVYKVDKWTKANLKLSRNNKVITIKCKRNQQIFYLMGFKLQLEVHATKLAMDINDAHKQLGHVGKDILCKMMNYYGIKLAGRLKACNGCMHAKANAQSTKKQTETVAQEPSEWIYLDATGPFPLTLSVS